MQCALSEDQKLQHAATASAQHQLDLSQLLSLLILHEAIITLLVTSTRLLNDAQHNRK